MPNGNQEDLKNIKIALDLINNVKSRELYT